MIFGMKAALAAAMAFVAVAGGAAHAEMPADGLVRVVAASETGPMDAQKACLAEAVFNEAGAEPVTGRIAVANVIINRTRSGTFPNTLCGVVNQKGQFSYVHGRGVRRGAERQWAEARAVAAIAMSGGLQDVAKEALYFRVLRLGVPSTMRRIASIGGHVFFANRR